MTKVRKPLDTRLATNTPELPVVGVPSIGGEAEINDKEEINQRNSLVGVSSMPKFW
jgi:hypothetical protein